MKPKLVIGIAAIVGFTSLLMYNFGNSISTYVDFSTASGMESAHVVGKLDSSRAFGFSKKDKQFTFFMVDQDGNTRRVIYPKPEPNNFEQAKKIVVIGKMKGNTFYANDMLMKCPSKYNNVDTSQFKKPGSSKI